MLGRTYDGQICSIARALEVVGERWTLLIIRDALQGLRRFEEFQRDLGIARNVLAARLGTLSDHGILEKVRYQQHPPRDEYQLTSKGRELGVAILALMQWGDRHLAGPEGPPRTARHANGCSGQVAVQLTCAGCEQPVDIHTLSVH